MRLVLCAKISWQSFLSSLSELENARCGDYKGIHAFKYVLTKTERSAIVGISGQCLAGVQATSGAKAPGFGALLHLRAVVERVSGATSDKRTGRKAAVSSPHTQSSAQGKVHRTPDLGASIQPCCNRCRLPDRAAHQWLTLLLRNQQGLADLQQRCSAEHKLLAARN